MTGYNIYSKNNEEPYLAQIGTATTGTFATAHLWAENAAITPRIYAVTAIKIDGSESFFSNMIQNDDRDHDGLTDIQEAELGTDPSKVDTDDDGYSDTMEYLNNTDPLDPTSFLDATAPTVTAFTLPTTSSSLTVAISSFTASDNVSVTSYCLVETNNSSGCTWGATAPDSYTFTTAGSKTLYAFARDAAGNISNSAIAGTTITLPVIPDTTAPSVTAFTLPATSTSLIVAISSFTASDIVGVTGYCLAATNNSSGCNWSATAPSSYTFTTAGSKILYAFAKDAAGNVSSSKSATTIITLPTVGHGDIDNDGVTSSTDAMFALQMAIGKKPLDLLKADVAPLINGVPAPDGKVTAADALVILRKAVGLW